MTATNLSRLAAIAALLLGLAPALHAQDILVADEKSQPESLTVAPGGVLIVGSASSPYVYKLSRGSSTAERFIDVSADGPGTFFLGMLADPAHKTLWTCELTPVQGSTPPQRHTALRGFDLSTGSPKLRWDLPGDSTTCNDFTIGPDKALYISDTANAKIYRLAAGSSSAELFLESPALKGIDGITFLNGVLYVNSVSTGKLFRSPVDGAGKAGQPVELQVDQPLSGPDGMRAANGKLFVAENRAGRISAITVDGDKASVTVIKEGLKTPTAVEPAGGRLWIAERGAGMVHAIALPK